MDVIHEDDGLWDGGYRGFREELSKLVTLRLTHRMLLSSCCRIESPTKSRN